MQTELTFARDFALILSTAFLGGTIAKRFRLPLVVGYLFAGIFVGTFLTRFIPLSTTAQSISEIGVALLLFTLGLELTLAKLKEFGEVIILGSFIQIILTTLIGALLFPFLGLDFYSALFLGAVFSLSSTAVVVKTLSDSGELETLHGEISAGWLFMQDLYTLPLMIILPAVGIMLRIGQVGFEPILFLTRQIFLAFFSFFFVLFLGRKIVPFCMERIADLKSRELLLIASVLFCLLFAFLFYVLGFSFAIGAFVAGILISSSSARFGIFAEVRPLRDLFSCVFFVSLGFILNPAFLFSYWQIILILVISVLTVKLLVSVVLVVLLGYHTKTAVLVGLSLISVGEFAFILAVVGVSARLISPDTYMIILWVTFLSLIISVPLMGSSHTLYYRFKKFVSTKSPWLARLISRLDKSPHPKLLSDSLKDHVVVLGFGRVGKYICRALSFVEIPYVVVDYNHHIVKKLQNEGIQVIYGDPAEIDVLRFAQVAQAQAVILAYADRHMQEVVITNTLSLNPKARLMCRVHFEEDQGRLKSLGVETIVQPEFEAAITLVEKLLRSFNVAEEEIEGKIKRLKIEHGSRG